VAEHSIAKEVAKDRVQSEQYYGVYLTGKKVGWAKETLTELADGGVRVTARVNMRIKRLNAELSMGISDVAEYNPLPDGRLRAFEIIESSSGQMQVKRSGKLDGDSIVITVKIGDQTHQKTVPASKENLRTALPKHLASLIREKPEETLVAWQFDRLSYQDRKLEIRLLESKNTRVHGVPVTLLKIQQHDVQRGIKTIIRVTGSGRVLEMAMGPSLRMVLEDRDIAMNPAAELPDLYSLSVIPIDKKLGSSSKVKHLELVLDGLPATLNLNDNRQKLDGSILTIERVSLKNLKTEALSDGDRKKWLATSAFVDHEHPAIVALSGKFGLQKNIEQRVRNMAQGVHERLQYTLSTAPPTASSILAAGKGDCTEYAMLLVAVARAAGLPARVVSGMAYTGDSDPGFAFHAWAEIHVNGAWLAADPTWNQVPVDATHIAFSRDDPTPIVGLIGGLKTKLRRVIHDR
jgi:hypothetical protein